MCYFEFLGWLWALLQLDLPAASARTGVILYEARGHRCRRVNDDDGINASVVRMSVTVDVDIQRLQDANVVNDVIADDVEWLPIDGNQTSTRSHRLLFNLSQLKTKKMPQRLFYSIRILPVPPSTKDWNPIQGIKLQPSLSNEFKPSDAIFFNSEQYLIFMIALSFSMICGRSLRSQSPFFSFLNWRKIFSRKSKLVQKTIS